MLRFLLASSPCALLLALAATGCGRAHDLGVTTGTTSGAGGGGGGGGGGGSASSAGSGGHATTSASSSSGTGGVDAGPPGPTELTVVNGVNDYDAVRFCFLPGDTPWPPAATGLPFAGSQVIAPVAAPIPADLDVTPWVIAGDLTQTAGKTCTEILALASGSAPPIVAQALGVIPQAVFASHKSLLLVADGCLGGAGHDDTNGVAACGVGYSSQSPTASLVLVSMSRVKDPAHVSLQVASASTVMPKSDVGILPNLLGVKDMLLAGSLSQGALAPTPPFAAYALADLGALAGVKIETYQPGTTYMQSSVALGTILAGSGVSASAFLNGASFVLVAVGASPSLPAGGFWHAFTYALVKAEPG